MYRRALIPWNDRGTPGSSTVAALTLQRAKSGYMPIINFGDLDTESSRQA